VRRPSRGSTASRGNDLIAVSDSTVTHRYRRSVLVSRISRPARSRSEAAASAQPDAAAARPGRVGPGVRCALRCVPRPVWCCDPSRRQTGPALIGCL
jgi:hypothetical protein